MNAKQFAANGVTGGGLVVMAFILGLNHFVWRADPVPLPTAFAWVAGVMYVARQAQGWLRWRGWLPPVDPDKVRRSKA